jgi:hypothetical protein
MEAGASISHGHILSYFIYVIREDNDTIFHKLHNLQACKQHLNERQKVTNFIN